jgi:hypothetical protein
VQKLLNFLKRLFITLRYGFRRNRIVVTQAVLSGKGSFVDICYWLSRPGKGIPPTKVYLIHQETGVHLEVMKLARIGPRQTNHAFMAKAGTALFRNRNGLVKPGSKVSLVFGNIRTDNIEVS